MMSFRFFGYPVLIGAIFASTAVRAEDTIDVRNGPNRATIGQNGRSGGSHGSIEVGLGYTRIEQHDRRNSAVIIQDSGSGTAEPLPNGLD